jgi:predicted AAA+ superfamily ATPase
LLLWKNAESRKPLLLDGARQVGKSYLLEHIFGREFFRKVHKFDFREQKELSSVFEESLDPKRILDSLQLIAQEKFNMEEDLIFLDEIGECQGALDSLKYFAEKMPKIFLCSSGSNLGLIKSFPVGKTLNIELFPMSFFEFLIASESDLLIEQYLSDSISQIRHKKLWSSLLDYLYVGGMPEAVRAWTTHENIIDRVTSVRQIHKDLILGYQRDFGKYKGQENALHIESVFLNIPTQLQRVVDASVKRFEFKSVIERKHRYQELRGPLDWLEKSKLISRNHIVTSEPKIPLRALSKDNIFKCFFFDVGLLNHLLEMDYREIIHQENSYRGYVAENFIQNELLTQGISPTYSWTERNSEIEFLLKSQNGDIIPMEIKSGVRTRAKSLAVYKEKYKPVKTIKLCGGPGGASVVDLVRPLYDIGKIKEFLR